jgi:hypothetical protein
VQTLTGQSGVVTIDVLRGAYEVGIGRRRHYDHMYCPCSTALAARIGIETGYAFASGIRSSAAISLDFADRRL